MSGDLSQPMAIPMDKLLISIPEASEKLSIGRTKLRELLARGDLPSVHIGRSVRIAQADLERYVARLRDDEEVDDFNL